MATTEAKLEERKRRRHSEEFKRQVVAASLEPGATVAAVALANGLKANQLRRWVRAHREDVGQGKALVKVAKDAELAMLPVMLAAGTIPLEIRLDVKRDGVTVQMVWPVEAVANLGPCLREWLR